MWAVLHNYSLLLSNYPAIMAGANLENSRHYPPIELIGASLSEQFSIMAGANLENSRHYPPIELIGHPLVP